MGFYSKKLEIFIKENWWNVLKSRRLTSAVTEGLLKEDTFIFYNYQLIIAV